MAWFQKGTEDHSVNNSTRTETETIISLFFLSSLNGVHNSYRHYEELSYNLPCGTAITTYCWKSSLFSSSQGTTTWWFKTRKCIRCCCCLFLISCDWGKIIWPLCDAISSSIEIGEFLFMWRDTTKASFQKCTISSRTRSCTAWLCRCILYNYK